jgi:hypothetical protein
VTVTVAACLKGQTWEAAEAKAHTRHNSSSSSTAVVAVAARVSRHRSWGWALGGSVGVRVAACLKGRSWELQWQANTHAMQPRQQ